MKRIPRIYFKPGLFIKEADLANSADDNTIYVCGKDLTEL